MNQNIKEEELISIEKEVLPSSIEVQNEEGEGSPELAVQNELALRRFGSLTKKKKKTTSSTVNKPTLIFLEHEEI